MSKLYSDYTNQRGKTYGASIAPGSAVHTRGWDAGVSVLATEASDGRAAFTVVMTSGSGGGLPSVVLGTVHDAPDGPHWEPADTSEPDTLSQAGLSDDHMDIPKIIADLEARRSAALSIERTATGPGIKRFLEGTANGLDIAVQELRDRLTGEAGETGRAGD